MQRNTGPRHADRCPSAIAPTITATANRATRELSDSADQPPVDQPTTGPATKRTRLCHDARRGSGAALTDRSYLAASRDRCRRGRAGRYPRRACQRSPPVRQDRATTREAARYDPTGFVSADGPMVIDEVQRVPELLLAIKEVVDTDPRPGRFLLTGSARLLALRGLPDALPGRMETIELWPLWPVIN
jgi:AAA domain